MKISTKIKLRHEPYDYQRGFYMKFMLMGEIALFADIGAGKTKMSIDLAVMKSALGQIDSVLVVAPKSVYRQWLDEALPEHAPEGFLWSGHTIDGFERHQKKNKKPYFSVERFPFLSMNFDAVATKTGALVISEFLKTYKKTLIIVDESQNIKNKKSIRWKSIFEIRQKCVQALILSGTPIAKNLEDYFAQYFFLDYKIIGEKYITGFRNKFCVLGGYGGYKTVGSKNEKELFFLTERNTFRIKNEDLPEKRYKKIVFEMGERQKKSFDSFKKTFILELEGGQSSSAQNAGVGLTRLQQITSGFFPTDQGLIEFENPRLEALTEVLAEVEGKIIIWCHFNRDVEVVSKKLGDAAVQYYGKTSEKDREVNKKKFISDESVRYLVASTATANSGIDGWQSVCSTSIYYSNSFNSIHRWQSEGRINRVGATEKSLFIDMVCKWGVDEFILKNIREKKSLSDLMLDDLRKELLN